MTAILGPRGISDLTRVIAGDEDAGGVQPRFDANEFERFISGLNDTFDRSDGPDFRAQVFNYLRRKNRSGEIGELLDYLGNELTERPDLLPIVTELVDSINNGEVAKCWFLSYAALEAPRFKELDQRDVFGFFREMLRKFAPSSSGRDSETVREDLARCSFFVALVGRYYGTSSNASGTFEVAFENWLSRISGDSSMRQRIVVLWLDAEGKRWWETKYAGRVPPDGQPLVKVLDASLATLKSDLDQWLNADLPGNDTPPTVGKQMVVLGEPEGAASAPMANAIEGLVACLHDRAPELVACWKDGWSNKVLTSTERAQLFARNPLFVRTILNRAATIGEAQADLKGYLMTALGYPAGQWGAEYKKLSRVFWRPDGPDWGGDAAGAGWAGPASDFAARLAQQAGLPNKADREAIVRYEDPRADNGERTEYNRQLVRTALQSAATRNGAGSPVLPNTVPISFDKIEDSIRKFARDGLNVIALHDLETRPLDKEDTLRRFEGADRRIDNAVNSLFGTFERDPILRVAILLKNARVFDGLKFDESSSVRRWYLLKCPPNENGQPTYDMSDYQNIVNAARDILANAAR